MLVTSPCRLDADAEIHCMPTTRGHVKGATRGKSKQRKRLDAPCFDVGASLREHRRSLEGTWWQYLGWHAAQIVGRWQHSDSANKIVLMI